MQSDCGAHSRVSHALSSHHPFQDIKQPTYRGPPTWLPFLPSKVASASIIYWATCRDPKQKLSWSPFITREWMMLDSAFSSSPPHPLLHLATLLGTILLPLSLPPVLKSQWDLSKIPPAASALHRSVPDYSFPLVSSSIHILPSPQDPEAGWYYKRRG